MYGQRDEESERASEIERDRKIENGRSNANTYLAIDGSDPMTINCSFPFPRNFPFSTSELYCDVRES